MSDDNSDTDNILYARCYMTAGETYYFKIRPVSFEDIGTYSIKLEKLVEATSISIAQGDTYTVNFGSEETFEVIFEPFNSIIEKVTWSSSDTSILTIDENGSFVPNKSGDTFILKSEGELTVIYSGKAFADDSRDILELFADEDLAYLDNFVFAGYSYSTVDFAHEIIDGIKIDRIFIEKKTENYFVFSINTENLFFLESNNLFYFMSEPKKLYFFISKEIENDWEYYNYVTEQNITEQSVFEKTEKNPILFRIVVTDSPTYDAVIRCNKGFLIRN